MAVLTAQQRARMCDRARREGRFPPGYLRARVAPAYGAIDDAVDALLTTVIAGTDAANETEAAEAVLLAVRVLRDPVSSALIAGTSAPFGSWISSTRTAAAAASGGGSLTIGRFGHMLETVLLARLGRFGV